MYQALVYAGVIWLLIVGIGLLVFGSSKMRDRIFGVGAILFGGIITVATLIKFPFAGGEFDGGNDEFEFDGETVHDCIGCEGGEGFDYEKHLLKPEPEIKSIAHHKKKKTGKISHRRRHGGDETELELIHKVLGYMAKQDTRMRQLCDEIAEIDDVDKAIERIIEKKDDFMRAYNRLMGEEKKEAERLLNLEIMSGVREP